METNNQAATIFVTVSRLKQWLSCCENMSQYAKNKTDLLIESVDDVNTGQKIKIVLIKA